MTIHSKDLCAECGKLRKVAPRARWKARLCNPCVKRLKRKERIR